jgi:hypothetical protein
MPSFAVVAAKDESQDQKNAASFDCAIRSGSDPASDLRSH